MSEKRYQVDIRQAGALATRAGTIIGGLDDDLDGMHAPAAHLWAVAQDLRNALTLTVHSLAELLAGGDATSPNFLGPDLDLGADAQHDRPVVGFDCDEISFDRAVELLHDLVGCGVGDRELLLSVVEARVRHVDSSAGVEAGILDAPTVEAPAVGDGETDAEGGVDSSSPSAEDIRVGATIATMRQLRGATQEQLARLAGYSRPYIANIERGRKRSDAVVARIAEVLQVPLGSIVAHADDAALSP